MKRRKIILTIAEAATVQAALDRLALSLSEKGRKWKPQEREMYEDACRTLGYSEPI